MDAYDKKLLWTVLLAILGGNSGAMLNAYSPSVRADAFTNTKAADLEARSVSRDTALANRLLSVEFELKRCLEKK